MSLRRWSLQVLVFPTVMAGVLVAASSWAQPDPPPFGEYGDAPEGALAYPATGVGGRFPTCYFGAPSGYITHSPAAVMWFGPDLDFETDGNEGICPPPTYDRDECLHPVDGDAGLVAPTPYTILPGDFVGTCSGMLGTAIGQTCSSIYFGPAFDMLVTNTFINEAYVNILVDWNQDGEWGAYDYCGIDQVEEWVLKNLPVPPGYTGPLSGLYPLPLRVGPNPGYVWTRFSVAERSMAFDSPGMGEFELGETEDYLLRVDPDAVGGDYGDAPEDAPAYPSAGTIGRFPTCLTGPSGYVRHTTVTPVHLGGGVDIEADGNGNLCPQPPYDEDECDASGGDAGLIIPSAYTVVAGVETTCPGSVGTALGIVCQPAVWGTDIDIEATNFTGSARVLNVLMDWNRDGEWGGSTTCGSVAISEHVLQNLVIPDGFSGPVSALAPPSFTIGGADYVWTRFTVSDGAVSVPWSGEGQFPDGETEDYLLYVNGAATGVENEGPGVRGERSSWGNVKVRFE